MDVNYAKEKRQGSPVPTLRSQPRKMDCFNIDGHAARPPCSMVRCSIRAQREERRGRGREPGVLGAGVVDVNRGCACRPAVAKPQGGPNGPLATVLACYICTYLAACELTIPGRAIYLTNCKLVEVFSPSRAERVEEYKSDVAKYQGT